MYVHEMKEMIQTSKESIIKQRILNANNLSRKIYSNFFFELTNPRRYQLQDLWYLFF